MSAKKLKGMVGDFIVGETDDIKQHYEFLKPIGQPGQFGYAMKVKHKESRELRAVKVISKARFLNSTDKDFHFRALKAEIKIMQQMDHPNIIKFHEVYETRNELYIVMELCTGGELFDRIKSKEDGYSEQDAARELRQICEALHYMHTEHKVAHCDLKPDNFLFLTPADDAPVKIIDFGMAKLTKPRKYFRSLCGTPYYVAPEVLDGHYTYHADMWSFGVVMFVTIFGYPPFYANQELFGSMVDDEIFSRIKKGFEPVVKEGWGAHFPAAMPISDSARDLMSKLLVSDVASRVTAQEALNHPWLKGDTASSEPLHASVVKNLRAFDTNSHLKTVVLHQMSDKMADYELEELEKLFKSMDENGDGVVTVEELRKFTATAESKVAEQLQLIFSAADVNGDGQLSYQELLLTATNNKILAKQERVCQAFLKLDKNHDGVLSPDEIEEALKSLPDDLFGGKKITADQVLEQVDKNNDGHIDIAEFLAHVFDEEQS